jgi:hypothetical protein
MRLLEQYTLLNFLVAGKDAGWVVAMALICVSTFLVSSMFVKRDVRHR